MTAASLIDLLAGAHGGAPALSAPGRMALSHAAQAVGPVEKIFAADRRELAIRTSC